MITQDEDAKQSCENEQKHTEALLRQSSSASMIGLDPPIRLLQIAQWHLPFAAYSYLSTSYGRRLQCATVTRQETARLWKLPRPVRTSALDVRRI